MKWDTGQRKWEKGNGTQEKGHQTNKCDIREKKSEIRHGTWKLRITFDECLEFLVLHFAVLHVNLECQEKSEHELVALVQTTCRVLEHSKR